MSYPLVTVLNSTRYHASGIVDYLSSLCSNDKYDVETIGTWTAKNRGVCLVTKVTATIETPDGNVVAEPYTSSTGTSYSNFAIIQTGTSSFEVTRRVTAIEDNKVPEDYTEPTEKQK